MVAVLTDSRPIFHPEPHRVLAAVATARSCHPRPDRAVYRRRRLLTAGVLLLLVAAALVTVQLALAGTGGGPLATTGAAAETGASGVQMHPAGAEAWTVRPGDTLWSIARAVDPNGDPRALVDALARETGGASLYPGERIPIPDR